MSNPLKNKKGFTVLEAVTGVVVLAVATTALLQQRALADRTIDRLTFEQEVESVRRYVRTFLSCSTTFVTVPEPCNDGEPIDIKQADGKILIAADGSTKVGDKFTLRNRCEERDLIIEV